MDTTHCPECGALAEIEWRTVMESTDGPIEHAKIRCAQRHWFLLPVAALAAPRQPVQPCTPVRPASTMHVATWEPIEAAARQLWATPRALGPPA
jgi:hypothetical protein